MPPCGPHSAYGSHSQHMQGMHTGGSSQTWIQGAYGGCERHGRLEHEGPPFNQHCDSPCIPVFSTNTNTAAVEGGIIGTTAISTPAGKTRVMHVHFPLKQRHSQITADVRAYHGHTTFVITSVQNAEATREVWFWNCRASQVGSEANLGHKVTLNQKYCPT